MDAKKIYSELKKKGYDVELNNMFSYSIDKERRFNLPVVKGEITRDLVSLIDNHNCMLVADTYVDVSGDEPVYSVKHSVYPKDMKSFDWGCE